MFDRIKQRIRESLGGTLAGMIRLAGNVSGSMHVTGMDRPAENLLWIYLGMQARTDAVSQVPLRISTGNDTIVESGALYELLSRPNQWMDWVQYLSMVEAYLALYNECEVAIVRGNRGNPIELVPLNPRHTTPVTGIHTETGVRIPVGWKYTDPAVGEMHVFKPEDVIPMVRYSPYDMTRSLWLDKPGKRAMQIDILAQEQNLAIFKNGGMPDVVFETDQRWTKEQRDEFMEAWQDRYGGTANAHKPGILFGGLKSTTIGLSPKALQFFEGRRMSRSEQIALMRVKPAMVGLMEGETGLSQGSSTVEQYASWWRSIGLGELALIASAHQRFLVDNHTWSGSATGREVTREERTAMTSQRMRMQRHGMRATPRAGLSVWFDEHEIEELMEQRLQKTDILDNLLSHGWEPDAAADYLGLRLPPHPTNVPTLPFSLQPAIDITIGGTQAAREQQTREGARHSKLDNLFADLGDELAGMAASGRARTEEDPEAKPEIPAAYKGLRNVLDNVIGPRERAAARKWSRHFTEQRGRVLDRYAELSAGTGTREDDSPQLEDSELSADGVLSSVFPRETEDGSLWTRIGPLITSHLRDGYDFFAEHDVPGATVAGFTVDDPRVMAAIDARKIQATEVNATTERQLRDLIRTAFIEGDTTTQLGDRLADYYHNNVGEAKARPMTAARTQTTGIVNDGRMLAAREAGGLLKGWLHGGSSQARDAHLAAQARYLEHPIPLDDKFEVNGYQADAPGSTELPVGEVANCTCTVTFRSAKHGDTE